ncbi:MAG: flagellar biosynthesis anti-sigma factor FlgM [Gammaproteobacteria bacterium]|nr:MAG: flagellar biosynthesis anti-sigma factor FlgM [Gammaproteobacteria bacterium]
MADKISAYGRAGLDISQTRNRPLGKAAEAGRPAEPGPAKADDAVDFSSTATQLKAVEARLREQPEVDHARVAELRERIESGRYHVSPERLAARLLKLEQELG